MSAKNFKKRIKNKDSHRPIVSKIFYEETNGKNLYIMITERNHEIDGTFKTKKYIKYKLNDIMIYPGKERGIKIKKNNRIIIEAKQNSTIIATIFQTKDFLMI